MGKPRTIRAWAGAWHIDEACTRVMIEPGLIYTKRSDARQHADLVVPVTITFDPQLPKKSKRKKP